MVCLHFNAQLSDSFDLHVENISGQSIGGYPDGEHPSKNRKGFVDRHPISEEAQIIGGCKACRPGANYQNFLTLLFFSPFSSDPFPFVLSHKSFQKPHGNGIIQALSQTGLLTVAMTDETAHSRERIDLTDHLKAPLH